MQVEEERTISRIPDQSRSVSDFSDRAQFAETPRRREKKEEEHPRRSSPGTTRIRRYAVFRSLTTIVKYSHEGIHEKKRHT